MNSNGIQVLEMMTVSLYVKIERRHFLLKKSNIYAINWAIKKEPVRKQGSFVNIGKGYTSLNMKALSPILLISNLGVLLILYKRGVVMSDAVSLTMGNSFLPFRNRLPHHMQLLRQRFLGISFFLSQYFDVITQHNCVLRVFDGPIIR